MPAVSEPSYCQRAVLHNLFRYSDHSCLSLYLCTDLDLDLAFCFQKRSLNK
ncbi:hypothetical protein LSH36_75g10063 [Paralvinella palmiformis]|uniref:Uncharacterized protein n=1 Tax=Paralvinella palmiformis TaxID=53620 RepID=A0AAD9K2R7_9ANNE|nr:hypothetical protein LSH36_75g10063 [Paralvinella palmiformis]